VFVPPPAAAPAEEVDQAWHDLAELIAWLIALGSMDS